MKAQKIPTPGTETSVFGFLAEMPEFTKFKGETNYIRPKTGSYQITVDDYCWATSIGKNDVKYDRFGLFTGRFKSAGAASKRFYEKNVSLLQKNGKTNTYGLAFDGQYFYDTDHPVGLDGSGSTFQNLWTGMALTKANIQTRYQYMCDLKDAYGNNLGIRPNIIEYGPLMMLDAVDIFESSMIANVAGTAGISNAAMQWLTKMGLTPIMNPNLGETGVWYLHDTRIMKPFIITEETPPTGIQARENPEDPSVWENNEYLYKADATAGFGYGPPQLSTRCEV
jgi:phage major head subunit gpT-like protein